jgi:hypothetical protein
MFIERAIWTERRQGIKKNAKIPQMLVAKHVPIAYFRGRLTRPSAPDKMTFYEQRR